jgi:hypothetical protein
MAQGVIGWEVAMAEDPKRGKQQGRQAEEEDCAADELFGRIYFRVFIHISAPYDKFKYIFQYLN